MTIDKEGGWIGSVTYEADIGNARINIEILKKKIADLESDDRGLTPEEKSELEVYYNGAINSWGNIISRDWELIEHRDKERNRNKKKK